MYTQPFLEQDKITDLETLTLAFR